MSFTSLDWQTILTAFGTLGSLAAAWGGIQAFLVAKKEYRFSRTPKVQVRLTKFIPSTRVFHGGVLHGSYDDTVLKPLVENMGSNIVDIWISISFTTPDNKRLLCHGWYGNNKKQLAPGERFEGSITWKEHFPEVSLEYYYNAFQSSQVHESRFVVIQVEVIAQDSTDAGLRCINPIREYLIDLKDMTLISYPSISPLLRYHD